MIISLNLHEIRLQMASKKAENKQKILMDKLKDIDVNYEEVVDQAAAGKKSTKHGKRKGKGKSL